MLQFCIGRKDYLKQIHKRFPTVTNLCMVTLLEDFNSEKSFSHLNIQFSIIQKQSEEHRINEILRKNLEAFTSFWHSFWTAFFIQYQYWWTRASYIQLSYENNRYTKHLGIRPVVKGQGRIDVECLGSFPLLAQNIRFANCSWLIHILWYV